MNNSIEEIQEFKQRKYAHIRTWSIIWCHLLKVLNN